MFGVIIVIAVILRLPGIVVTVMTSADVIATVWLIRSGCHILLAFAWQHNTPSGLQISNPPASCRQRAGEGIALDDLPEPELELWLGLAGHWLQNSLEDRESAGQLPVNFHSLRLDGSPVRFSV